MHRSRLGGHMAGGSSKQARKRAKKSSSSANSRGKSTTGSNGRRRARKKAATGPTQAVRTQTRRALADIFPGVAPSTLARGVTTRELRAGDILCEEGDPADAAWVIVTGRLRASVREGEQTRILGDNGPGELIGEAALLDGGVRAATLRAVRDTRVAVLDQAWLAQLMTSSPDAIQRVLASVLERRQRANVIQDRVVTLLPATPSAVATAEAIAGRLADTMDAVVVRSGDRTGRGGTWLTRLEDAHDLVVLVADPEWSGWTEQVTRSADRLAIVVDVEDGAAPSEVEIAAEGNGRDANDRRVLVLAHPPATERPRGTRAWLAERTVDLHLHMRRDDAGDLGRVARHLANQAVGLVLGGGGARGLAELGVWKTLDEHGVPVDLVTGSSMGAVMGTLVAIGMTPDDALDHARRAFEGIKDPTLPVASLVRGRRLWDQIQDTVGDMDLEDAWITFACMSTDLTAMTPYVHRTGAFADALRASLAIPGVFTPVDINGHLHVDGGLLDNLPVDAASEIDPTARLIVVDVAPPGGPRAVEHIPRDLSGWRLLRQRLLPWAQAPRVPPLVATMLQSTFVGAGRQRLAALASEQVALHLNLHIRGYSLLEFEHLDEIVEIGRTESLPIVRAWLRDDGDEIPHDPAQLVAHPELDAPPAPVRAPAAQLPDRGRRALAGGIHLAVQDLLFRSRRFGVTLVASAVVLALYLVMTGVVSQLQREADVTIAAMGGTHWVIPEGSPGPFTSNATVTADQAQPLLDDGAPILTARYAIEHGGEQEEVVLVGHAAGGPGAPDPSDGRLAVDAGEVAVAEDAGLHVGDEVLLGRTPVTVVGVIPEATVLAGIPLVFVPIDAARDLVVDGRPLLSAVLVDGEPATLPEGMQAPTSAEVAESTRQPLERPITTVQLVRALLTLVAALIIGAVVYLATVERTRDLAVLRATGTQARVLGTSVAAQAVVVGVLASLIAMGLQALMAPAFPMRTHLSPANLWLLPAIATLIAVAASYGAIRRTLRVDPVSAFAGPGA